MESPGRMRNFGSMEKFYCHFKGNVYRLVGIAKDSETLEELSDKEALALGLNIVDGTLGLPF